MADNLTRNEPPLGYFIKHGWIGIPDVIYTWQGYQRRDARGNSLNGIELIKAFPINDKLFVIFKRDFNYLAGILDKNNNVGRLIEIPKFWRSESVESSEIIGQTHSGRMLFLLDKLLYSAVINGESVIRIDLISENVSSTIVSKSKSNSFDFAYSQVKELNSENLGQQIGLSGLVCRGELHDERCAA